LKRPGCLLYIQSSEEAKFHDLALPRVELRKGSERVVKHD
jgi:hypothetical protein